jgi:hypothetical protein
MNASAHRMVAPSAAGCAAPLPSGNVSTDPSVEGTMWEFLQSLFTLSGAVVALAVVIVAVVLWWHRKLD